MDIRLVVTGHDEAGKAVVRSDEVVEPVTVSLVPGFGTYELWHTDETPQMRDDLGERGVPTYFPPPGGSVLRVVRFGPDGAGVEAEGFDVGEAIEEFQRTLPALAEKLEPDNPGMHTTDSVDYGIVLSGELELELDDGARTTVGPGTIVVQRGTRHAWRNRSGREAYVAFVLLGARPAD